MLKLSAVVIVLACQVGVVSAQECLHGPMESPSQKVRRNQALALAVQINMAQRRITPGRGPRFRPLEELSVPPTPQGFDLQYHTDGATYSFIIKDRLDPCKYAVFSDQDAEIYEALPRKGGPILVPLDTRQ